MQLRHLRALVGACGKGGVVLAFLLAASCASHKPLHAEHGHKEHRGAFHKRFEDAEAWSKVFDDPARDAWQKPDVVMKELAVAEDAKIADVGAGTGYFSVRLARAAPKGTVYATDIEPDMVRYLADRAKKENLPNLVPILSAEDDAKIPEPVDLILVVDTYHHINARPAYFGKLASALSPNGRLVIIDFTLEAAQGPPKHARFAPEEVTKELQSAGLKLKRAPDVLPDQYLLIFTR